MELPVKTRSLLIACALLVVACLASADTLYLKNGMYIVVTKATEKDGEIEYWVGSTKYTISKDLVAKIEPGNGPSTNTHSATAMHRGAPAVQDLSRRDANASTGTASHDKLQLPAPGGPKQHEPYWDSLRTRI